MLLVTYLPLVGTNIYGFELCQNPQYFFVAAEYWPTRKQFKYSYRTKARSWVSLQSDVAFKRFDETRYWKRNQSKTSLFENFRVHQSLASSMKDKSDSLVNSKAKAKTMLYSKWIDEADVNALFGGGFTRQRSARCDMPCLKAVALVTTWLQAWEQETDGLLDSRA